MPLKKIQHRVIENVGEIWRTDDGKYSYRVFNTDITSSGFRDAHRAEVALERKAATEYLRRAGQLEGYESRKKCKPWYGISAASYVTGAWDKSKTRRAIDRAMGAKR